MLQNSSTATSSSIQPKVVVIRRRPNQGFGFTLRHFIAYPPEDDPSWPQEASDPYQVKAMETIFIKEVQPNGPAHYANLQTGDRVLMVNNTPIAGVAYSTIVSMIKQTPSVLTLHVVPKECDVLQMHYTSIAHTPESNRLTAVPKRAPSPVTVGNGNAAGALIPIAAANAAKTFPQQLISYPPLGQGNRSNSITSTTSSSSLRPLASGNNLEYGDMHSSLLMRGDGGFLRSQPPSNLTVLTRQQPLHKQSHHQLQQHPTIYASNAIDTSDLMIRLRESIKQKEEFLKSPSPHASSLAQQQQQHFFPHTPPSGSPQLSMVSTSSTSGGSSSLSATPRGQIRTFLKQPLSSSTSSASSTRELLPASCDMHNFYIKNVSGNFIPIESMLNRNNGGTSGSGASGIGSLHNEVNNSTTLTTVGRGQKQLNSGISSSLNRYRKELDYMETLQETGVTNKVFESKLNSHMAKGFDPFKPLSINTNAIESSAAPGNVILMKKPGVLYESLQHHPLHQMQIQQLQQTQLQQPKMHHLSNNNGQSVSETTNSGSVVDGQHISRMEIHKASLATTIEHTSTPKFKNKLPEAKEKPNTLANIAESNCISSIKAVAGDEPVAHVGTGAVVRRSKPVSALDDNKPMRRISYLRATNNENDYQSDTSSANTSLSTSGVVPEAANEQIEEDSDPTYDVVSGDCDAVEESTPSDAEIQAVVPAESGSGSVSACASRKGSASASVGGVSCSRRASVSSEIRESVHIENVPLELNGKTETKDVSTEMEIFETEMEIKSSCIYGKRLSEYRSWRQVKIEIKGDILKIYPSRTSKSDNNLIELDIKNFKIFDESIDKKKYMFRMQSKPVHLATLGNDLSIDESPDKLTSTKAQMEQQQYTEILFKTKSQTEMRRIFGLLQWKNSLIYDENDLHGKQLAEPQKTAATASMPTATYCDDNVQQPEYSPLSSTSRSEVEVIDSISPVMKTRKSSSNKNVPDKDLGSPKSKNWKDLLFRRGGHSADISPSNLASTSKTTGSIGVPLKTCPMSKSNEFVPNIVEVCTNIVETKGLGVVGIYRIPGNKAAISELSEQVNKNDFSWDRCNTDVRWEDVNVVSSLLKLFIRSLPDALLPSSFYNNFIEADKKTGLLRLKELKDLLESLPRYSYETMKHLIRHLNRVSKNCDVNLMEPKNLAIIFGPSIIRTPNETLEIAVKDMKHQCRIVELLVTQYEYFFESGTTPDIADVSGNTPATISTGSLSIGQQSQEDQTNMLLHNVSKIERLTERETSRTSRFIPQLRRRTHSKRSAVSSDTYSGESVLSLEYSKNAQTTSSSSTNVNTASSSSSSSTNTTSITTKKKERTFLGHSSRTHHRKASLDEKDSGSGSGSGGSISKEKQRSSVDISILLTDDESSNSRISDTGSMSLTTITDTLDSKLRNLRSGSESNDENGSPEFPKNRRHTFGQPLHLHSENIPYADESPERHFHNSCPLDAPNTLMLSRSCTATNTISSKHAIESIKEKELRPPLTNITAYKSNKLQHSATAPIHTNNGGSCAIPPPTAASTPTAVVTVKTTTAIGTQSGNTVARNSSINKNIRFSSSVYEQVASEDDSEGSTTSDPKESLVITSPSFFQDRYNKKRRDHRLFRSASFNCRNYSTRHGGGGGGSGGIGTPVSTLTKDEKTDMNLTKKRQIQNKQNRSIKRRHTVGGPHDYSASNGGNSMSGSNCNHHCKSNNGTVTTTVLRRIPIPSANGNIANNNNNNNAQQSDGSNGNGSAGTTVSVAGGAGEHVLEVGIRIKNINRGRY
ncbi:rho GTPase-activating protein 21-A isoform X2 [Teleopsis dalmanni]|uniref:rho GTPase-activating protein 21-A isoform X2 n=1 Tax=Teleopsis dalmanni TaxID=139649 RepID=UPI0018CD350B|nr:rho GTPase-activating protein 21-A isoform X2 [Teleopsis dalmanni]